MPIFDYQQAKRDGVSDEQISSFIDEQRAKRVDLYIPKQQIEQQPPSLPSEPQTSQRNLFTAMGLAQRITSGVGGFLGLAPLGGAIRQSARDVKTLSQKGIQGLRRIPSQNEYTPTQIAGSALQAASYLTPGGVLRGVTGISKIARPVLRSAAEFGVRGYGIGVGQKLEQGGNIQQAAVAGIPTAAVSALAAPIAAAIGKGAQKLGVRLYKTVFKQTISGAEQDVRDYFYSLAKKGTINKELAEELIQRQLKGTETGMAIDLISRQAKLENQIQSKVGSANVPIRLDNKKEYVTLLQSIKDHFGSGFFTKRADDANALIEQLKGSKGTYVSMKTMLDMRRFLDSVRNTSSFRVIGSPLAARQEEFKAAADQLRSMLAKQGGLQNLMKEYKIYIDGLDALVQYTVRKNRLDVLNLTDAILGGGGLSGGFPGAGFGLAGAVRAFKTPISLTGVGSALYNLPKAASSLPGQTLKRLFPLGVNKTIQQ